MELGTGLEPAQSGFAIHRFNQFSHPSLMVEEKGLEPLILPCKGNVLPVKLFPHFMARGAGLEPATYGVKVRCSTN